MKKEKLETVTTRMRAETKEALKDEARRQKCTIQELAEKIVIQYLNNSQYSSRIEVLSLDNRQTIEQWALALHSGNSFAGKVMDLMEFCIEKLELERRLGPQRVD